MRRYLLLAVVVGSVSTGCLSTPKHERPARLLIGANSRGLATADSTIAAREAAPSSTDAAASGAYTASGQFTMAFRNFMYGFELETGRLDARGSNFAGAYGVIGAEHATRTGSIGVELVGGWRGVRERSGADDVNSYVAEPRVRGQYRIGEQVSLGGVLGATLAEGGSWMVGLNVGFYSHVFGN